MPSIPSASVSISEEANAAAGGTGYIAVFACCELNADLTPRVFGSIKSIMAQHGYAPGIDYVGLHIDRTKKQAIFIGVPTATPGVLGRQDGSGVSGTSVISVTPGPNGYLEETDASVVVDKGGTVGTDDIRLVVSLDGGRTKKNVRLGTKNNYAVPYVGIVLGFGAGTLVAGDTYKFTTTAPKWDGDGIAAARAALQAQQKATRSWLVVGDLVDSTEAESVVTEVNGYETDKKRFTGVRANVRDRLPLASMSRTPVRMTGAPNLTYAEVGATGDTITRSAGSFVTDGFVAGMAIDSAGSASNNFTKAKITAVTDATLTLDTQDLTPEGPVAGCSITGSFGLTFAATTATRSGGSWLDDGFAVGDTATFAGTASNNAAHAITALTATVMTFAGGGVAEFIGTKDATCTKGETMAAWVSAMDAAFDVIDAQKRTNLGLGRLWTKSPITGWSFRRPVQWAASIRQYQHDIHHPTWTKEDGPLQDWGNTDANGNVVEFDEDEDGGGLAGRFTCARTWGNGPLGPFIACDLTRDTEGSLLSLQHNMDVANVCCTVVQTATENFVGKTPQVNPDGTATAAELERFELSVNTDLSQALRVEFVPGEGPRASLAVWKASTTDILNVSDATLNGAADLEVNGTIFHVETGVTAT